MPSQFKKNIGAKQFIYLLLGIVFIAGLFLRLEALFSTTVNQWVVRDFDRSFSIIDGDYLPLAGSELGNGGRLPGPFMYFFNAIPLLFNKSYESIFIFNLFFNVASIIILFSAIKKYLNILTASITTALISINFHHIEAVLFPINPAYIFPFVAIYVWLLFEYILNKSNWSFIFLILVLVLAIQFHYSIITLCIVPIVLVLLFKIRIPIKNIIAGLIIIGISLIPYAIYKKETFIPTNVHGIQSNDVPNFLSISETIKTIAVQRTIARIANSRGRLSQEINFPKNWNLFYRLLLSTALYFLIFHTFSTGIQNALKNRQKEIIVLCMFYFPALSYDIYGPFIGHYWYEYIFVIPQSILMGLFFSVISEKLTSIKIKTIYLSAIGLTLLTFTFLAFYSAKNAYSFSRERFKLDRYKTIKSLSAFLMKKTNLSSQNFIEKVYIQGFNPESKKILQLASASNKQNLILKVNKKNKICFFIHKINSPKHLEYNKNLFLLHDPGKKIIGYQVLSFPEDTKSISFRVYKYTPLKNQSCYRNIDNPFVVNPKLRSILKDASKLTRNPLNVVELLTISKNEVYNSDNQLNIFSGNYIIGNESTQVPFRFKLKLEKQKNGYLLNGDIEKYYFWGTPNFKLSNLQVLIKPNSKSQYREYEIFPQKTILNTLGSSNLFWSKEMQLPDQALIKGELDIKLMWSIDWRHSNSRCCSSKQINYLNLTKAN